MKNDLAKRMRQQRDQHELITKAWTAQLCMDAMEAVLNDSEVMGRDTLGEDRLRRVMEAFNAKFCEYYPALTKNIESSYLREKIDQRKRQIFKKTPPPSWAERYEFWSENGEI